MAVVTISYEMGSGGSKIGMALADRLGYRYPDLTATEASRQAVQDRALASRVRVALAAHPGTRKYRINVEADQGIIQLEGTAALDTATEVARAVPGWWTSRASSSTCPRSRPLRRRRSVWHPRDP